MFGVIFVCSRRKGNHVGQSPRQRRIRTLAQATSEEKKKKKRPRKAGERPERNQNHKYCSNANGEKMVRRSKLLLLWKVKRTGQARVGQGRNQY